MRKQPKAKPVGDPEAPLTGWIATGRCIFCLNEIETLHPKPSEATTRHVLSLVQYLECERSKLEAELAQWTPHK